MTAPALRGGVEHRKNLTVVSATNVNGHPQYIAYRRILGRDVQTRSVDKIMRNIGAHDGTNTVLVYLDQDSIHYADPSTPKGFRVKRTDAPQTLRVLETPEQVLALLDEAEMDRVRIDALPFRERLKEELHSRHKRFTDRLARAAIGKLQPFVS